MPPVKNPLDITHRNCTQWSNPKASQTHAEPGSFTLSKGLYTSLYHPCGGGGSPNGWRSATRQGSGPQPSLRTPSLSLGMSGWKKSNEGGWKERKGPRRSLSVPQREGAPPSRTGPVVRNTVWLCLSDAVEDGPVEAQGQDHLASEHTAQHTELVELTARIAHPSGPAGSSWDVQSPRRNEKGTLLEDKHLPGFNGLARFGPKT